MELKLVFIASGIVVLVLLAAPSTPAFAHQTLTRSAETSLGAPTYPNRIEGSAGIQNTSQNDQPRRLSPGAVLGLICAVTASSLALGLAFGLRRRIDRIAGPNPDKEDDQ
ncbi:MAG TPA: hypothetical protein VFU22_21260 [Roseiflexaceae bacterium]|nr:hypothetical protein [Roseiflexaceae bacterium]